MYAITKEDREYDNSEITDLILEKTADIDAEFDINTSAVDMSALTGSGVRLYVKGRDLDKLRTISEDVMKLLENVDGLSDISNGLEDSGEEYRITVDKAKAMKYTLTVAQVYAQIRAKVAEATSSATLSTDTNDYDIYVKSEGDESLTRDMIEALELDYTDTQTQKSKKVKLSKIASFETVASPTSIRRTAQSRYVAVSAKIDDGYIVDNVSAAVEKKVNSYELPDGYEIEFDGENEATQEAIGQVMLMLLLAIILMYLIMVAQFQGLLSPFIILFTIPLAFTGGFIGLYLSGSDVSVIALVGFVMLSGIIVNNGIVLVDYTNQLRITGEGMDKRDAIVEAGRTRLRPILMTAITTILGLLPMVASHDLGSDMTRPMAIVVIGGLTYGTLLTLFVVPCMYDLFARRRMRTQAELDAIEAEIRESQNEVKAIEIKETNDTKTKETDESDE